LDLAARLIAESSVVLKNEGDVLPLSKSDRVGLAGSEACSSDPLATAGGSGWNGFACNDVPKINVKDGIANLPGSPIVQCSDSGAGADIVVVVVAPEKASEGSDRSTLQLHGGDIDLIKRLSQAGKKVVVVINAPGPMITSTWDSGVAAILITWLPGQQNGRGIAMALYADGHEASGRLPFTFPKCQTAVCSGGDERASVALGEARGEYTEKALIGYRWYHANKKEVSYAFGYGLFAYGAATMLYGGVQASRGIGNSVDVSVTLSHTGPRAGDDVPQLYLSFPSSVPGDANSKPEWVLKGFQKRRVEPHKPLPLVFTLWERDLSYWDDAPGRSLWVCATGSFRVCVGANAVDAIKDPSSDSCTTFASPCSEETSMVI